MCQTSWIPVKTHPNCKIIVLQNCLRNRLSVCSSLNDWCWLPCKTENLRGNKDFTHMNTLFFFNTRKDSGFVKVFRIV